MAERRATNKYYPPDWTPDQGSINKYVGQHPLRDRARKLDQGILIIRFELPYNIWCNGCGNHVAMGVRFNAEKKKVGMYYTTPIYSFRMKCHLCDNWWEIRTDPQARDYVITEGARRKVETWDAEENGQFVLPAPRSSDEAEAARRAENPLARLEHAVEDEAKAKRLAGTMTDLINLRNADWKDDYELSRRMRAQFRVGRKAREADAKEGLALAAKASLDIPILPKDTADEAAAAAVRFRGKKVRDTALGPTAQEATRKRLAARVGSIFDPDSVPAAAKKARLVPRIASHGPSPVELALLAQQRGISYRRFKPPTEDSAGSGGESDAAGASAAATLAQQASVVASSVRIRKPAGAAGAAPKGLVDYGSDSE